MGYFSRQYWPEPYYAPEYWGEPNVDLSATLSGAGSVVADFSVSPDILSATLAGVGTVVADFQVGADVFFSTLKGQGAIVANLTQGNPTYWAQEYFADPYFAEGPYWGYSTAAFDLSATLSGSGSVDATLTAFPRGFALSASMFEGAVPWNYYYRARPKGTYPEKPFGSIDASLSVPAGALGAVLVGEGAVVSDFTVWPDVFEATLQGQGSIVLANLSKSPYLLGATLVGTGTVVADFSVSADVFSATLSGVGSLVAELEAATLRATLSGVGSVVADLETVPNVSLSSTLAGVGSIDAEIKRSDFSSALAGFGSLISDLNTGLITISATLSGRGVVSAELTRARTLSPGDFDAIIEGLWDKLVSEGLVTQTLETWQRQGCDSANPQVTRRDGVSVGNIEIAMHGNPATEITETRQ